MNRISCQPTKITAIFFFHGSVAKKKRQLNKGRLEKKTCDIAGVGAVAGWQVVFSLTKDSPFILLMATRNPVN